MALPGEDIVITGLSARFPQANSLAEFKEKLYAGADFVTNGDARWPRACGVIAGYLGLPERHGTIQDLSRLDAQFFGLNPKQAHLMDPQMRILLETSYEAMVDAGYDPETLRGRRVGVFIGCTNSDSHEAFNLDPDKVNGYGFMGSARAMFSNRLSYTFDFHGPSFTVDSGCASTMTALNEAILSLRSGQCDAAIVGGSMVSLNPTASLSFLRLGMLSPEGKCKPFDSSADGYVRSETVGVFFLQRASDARRIYAKIAHVKAYSDGYKSKGVIFPSSEAQERLLRDVYAEAKVNPSEVAYVEAHGTGTKAGDSYELRAISNVFCQPERDKPLMVGSVKSNMGHAEAASGVGSVAKTILAMETGIIAGNLHFTQANPDIPSLHDGSVKVVDKATPLPGGPVGINSFGLGGSSVHAILESGPGPHVRNIPHDKSELPRLVLVAGRSKGSLEHTLERIEKEGPYPDSAYALLNCVGQPRVQQFPYRGFTLVSVDGSVKEAVKAVELAPHENRPLWFVFTGMGCQWNGMARQMMQFDVFARSIRKSHEALEPLGVDLVSALTSDMSNDRSMASVQACIGAVQVALVDTLNAVGIRPDGIVGHSVGEVGCAYADGALTLEQTLLCAYWRGRCIEMADLPKGAMAAVGLTWEEASKRCRDGVVPACHNAVDTVTVSGPAEAVAKLVEELKAEGVFVREVDSMNVPFHSEYMRAMAPAFQDALQKIIQHPKLRNERWISSSVPKSQWHAAVGRHCSAEYHVNNVLSPVFFYEALSHLPKNAIAVEIGPHCLLQPILRRVLGSSASSLGLMKRDSDNPAFFLTSLGKLHTLGVQIDLAPLYPPVPFPVPRGTPSIGHLVSWDHSQRWTVANWSDFASTGKVNDVVEINVESNDGDAYLAGHQLDGRMLFPAAGYVVLAWKSLAKRSQKPFHQVPVVLEDVTFHRATILPNSGSVRFVVHVMPASGDFEISEAGTVVASGRICIAQGGQVLPDAEPMDPPAETVAYDVDAEDFYKEFRLRGYEYSGGFLSILKVDAQEPWGKLKWENNWVTFIDSMLQFYIFQSRARNLRVFAKIQWCHIAPQVHAEAVKDCANTGVVVLCDAVLNTCRAGGVSMRGLKAATAQRRNVPQTLCLERYAFVPYVDNLLAMQKREATLREYVDMCSEVARCIRHFGANNSPDSTAMDMNSCDAPEDVLRKYNDRFPENNGLLRILTSIRKQLYRSGLSLAAVVHSALATHRNELDTDILNTALLDEDTLRPLLDVAVENTSSSKIRVVELAFKESSALLMPRVSKFLPLFSRSLKAEYAIVHPCPEHLTLQELPEGVTISSWDPASTAKNGLFQADFVVAWTGPHHSNSLETLAKQLSIHCHHGAFVLLCRRTDLTPTESFLSEICNVPFKPDTKEKVKSVLGAEGFRLVGLKSNNWSTLFLLRNVTTESPTLRQEVIRIRDASFDWVEILKAKLLECEKELGQRKLWLVAQNTSVSGVVGLMNCLRLETGGSYIRCLFDASLEGSNEVQDFKLSDPAYKEAFEKDLVMNIRRDGQWGSYRHLTMQSSGVAERTTEYAFLNVQTRGDLSSLQWYESPLRYASPSSTAKKLLCSVYYAPLNFRDVMLATGKLPPDALPEHTAASECLLGLEFAGRDPEGRRIIGLVPSEGMATVVVADSDWLWEVPDAWSLKEASTIPVAYSTAYYALLVRGNMQPGESLLVHSGSGGVGQAAISIALSMGCTVFTTVGSTEKREFLKRRFPQLGDWNIASSRDLSFEQHVLRKTKGKGVDLVLNSLAEEKLQASVRCLSKHGRFLEIGKSDLSNDSALGMSVFLKNVAFHGILLETLHEDAASAARDKHRVHKLVLEGITSGAVRPLDTTVFPRHQAEQAFRFMATAKHLGKVVLEIRKEEGPHRTCPALPLAVEAVTRTYFHSHKSYVIVGGLGGMGLELADWMVRRGCRKIVLSSRSGVRTGYQKLRLRGWQEDGVKVFVMKADVSTGEASLQVLDQALALGPVGGIFNLAMVLRDALVENQTAESFQAVCRPKVEGTKRLDELTRRLCPELDHFVVFSSVACGRGNPGQTNYAYANSAMERICERRVADGLPGLAIQWGPVGDVGVLQHGIGDNVKLADYAPQRISSCMNVLDQFLSQKEPIVSSFLLADHSSECRKKNKKARNLVGTIAHIFGLKEPSSLNPNTSLGDLGMDSLMGVEVKQTLERDYDLPLCMSEIRQLTIMRLREIGGEVAETGEKSVK